MPSLSNVLSTLHRDASLTCLFVRGKVFITALFSFPTTWGAARRSCSGTAPGWTMDGGTESGSQGECSTLEIIQQVMDRCTFHLDKKAYFGEY